MRTEENLPRDLVFTQEDQERLPAFEKRHCTSGLTHLNYLLHCKSVTTCPNGKVTTCPNVISITKFVVVEKYGAATYIQGSVFSHNHEQVYMHNI